MGGRLCIKEKLFENIKIRISNKFERFFRLRKCAPGGPKHGYIFSNAILGLKEAEIAKNGPYHPLFGRKSPKFTFTVVRMLKFQCCLLFWRSNIRKFDKNCPKSEKRLFPSKKKFYEGVELRFQKEKINTLNLPPLSYGQKIFYQI